LFSDEMVRENLKFYSDRASEVDLDAPFRYATDFLMVPTDAPVLSRLQSDSRWRRVYADSDAVLFERADAVDRMSGRIVSDSGQVTSQKGLCEVFLN
jgi:hypothetical protein